MRSITVHICELGLVCNGQAAGCSGCLQSLCERPLSNPVRVFPFDFLRQTPEIPDFLHESFSLGKPRSITVHICELGLVCNGQAAGCSGIV